MPSKPRPKRKSKSLQSREQFRLIFHQILQFANQGLPRIDFLREVSQLLLDFSGADVVELRLLERNQHFRCEARRYVDPQVTWEVVSLPADATPHNLGTDPNISDYEFLCWVLMQSQLGPGIPQLTEGGSFFIRNSQVIDLSYQVDGDWVNRKVNIGKDYPSIALLPIFSQQSITGLIILKSSQPNFLSEQEISFYESLGHNLGVALAYRHTQVALRERVKELTCLYGIAQLAEQPDLPLDRILQEVVDLLPPAWLYPEIAQAQIQLNGTVHKTPDFTEGNSKQTADIIVKGQPRGRIEVVYTEKRPLLDEGPFLKEERSLIDTIAREVALIIERRQAEEEKTALQAQLRHADRLATIGQLAAGVAHELNEPLGNVLGFAQLAKKAAGLPESAASDIDKIIRASLYAREVIRKLMLFSRQVPSRKSLVDVNKVVEESLNLLQVRLAKGGVTVVRELAPDIPEVAADGAQLNQVLVNLIVNAAQAMPEGGQLTFRTFSREELVYLTVEDTGIGMSDEVLSQIFLPFFTTKDVNQGTGLGLAVVHGIITAHGGTISVESQVGQGTKFTIRLPAATENQIERSIEDGGSN